MELLTGIVFLYNKTRGFGYIVTANCGKEIFFEGLEYEFAFERGDRVSFYLQESEKGITAKEIKVLSKN